MGVWDGSKEMREPLFIGIKPWGTRKGEAYRSLWKMGERLSLYDVGRLAVRIEDEVERRKGNSRFLPIWRSMSE